MWPWPPIKKSGRRSHHNNGAVPWSESDEIKYRASHQMQCFVHRAIPSSFAATERVSSVHVLFVPTDTVPPAILSDDDGDDEDDLLNARSANVHLLNVAVARRMTANQVHQFAAR